MTINLENIAKECCEEFNVPTDKFFAKTRVRRVTLARQMFQLILRERLRMSYNEIADSVIIEGKRHHHTTVMHSVTTLKDYISIGDKHIIQSYENINKRLDAYRETDSKTVTIHFLKNEPIDEFIFRVRKRYPDVRISVNSEIPLASILKNESLF